MQSETFNKRFSRLETGPSKDISTKLMEEAIARAARGQRKSAKKFIAKLERADSANSSPEASPVKNKWADFSNNYVRPKSKQNDFSFNTSDENSFHGPPTIGGINLKKINVNA